MGCLVDTDDNNLSGDRAACHGADFAPAGLHSGDKLNYTIQELLACLDEWMFAVTTCGRLATDSPYHGFTYICLPGRVKPGGLVTAEAPETVLIYLFPSVN